MSALPNWPHSFEPARMPVFAHNAIVSTRPAENHWPILLRAAQWPAWYAHASDVKGIADEGELSLGTTFSWRTLGVRVTTTVTELVPYRALAWSGVATGSRGYHRWDFRPRADGGCTIITEEVQAGPVPTMLAARLSSNLTRFHQEWLESLVARV